MTTRFDDDLQVAEKNAALVQEQVRLLNRLQEIEIEIAGGVANKAKPAKPFFGRKSVVASGAASVATGKRGPGRPKKVSTDSDVASVATGKRGPGRPKSDSDDGKRMELPALLKTIAKQSRKPLAITDFVVKVREAGYKSEAKDFSNMIYQCLLKLVGKGVFSRDKETRTYEFVGGEAA